MPEKPHTTRKPHTKKRPTKAVHYTLISPQSESGRAMYELLYSVVDEHHLELSCSQARIALAWATSWKADVDGRLKLGQCKKASDLDRELAPYDFVVLLNREFWQNLRVTDLQRRALLDHELMHATLAYDENGEPKIDDRGRHVYRLRKHDLEEFSEIAERYGCWKRDIEQFAQALVRADKNTPGWVGYTSLQARLAALGLHVSLEVITAWNEAARREVQMWALLRDGDDIGHVDISLSPNVPACLADALRAAQRAGASTSVSTN